MRASALLALFLAVPPAQAIDLGLRQTFGKDGYKGTNVYGEFDSGPLSLRPEADIYSTDFTQGTYKTVSARLGYDTSVLGLGVTAGVTPENDGYKNAFGGADAVVTLSGTGGGSRRIRTSGSGAPRGTTQGLARIDVGAGVLVTDHEDQFGASHAALSSENKLVQTDLNLFAGMSFAGLNLSGNFTTSSYDKTIDATFRPAPRLALNGIDTRVQGYPETSLTLRGELPFLPMINPFAVFNRTTYKSSPVTTNTYGVGGSIGLQMLELYGSFEVTHPTGASGLSDVSGVTVGASLRFGLGE